MPKHNETVQRLLDLRNSTDLKIKMPSRMKEGTVLRPYQAIGCLHLFAMPAFYLGDATGLGKSIQAITAYAYWLDKRPEMKLIVCTTNSAVLQWAAEVEKFTRGIKTRAIAFDHHAGFESMKEKRALSIEKWAKDPTENVLIMNYAILFRDYPLIEAAIKENNIHLMVIYDESNAFKNSETKLFSVVFNLARLAERTVNLSATPLRNRIAEVYAQFKVLHPILFPSKTAFENLFVRQQKVKIKGGRIVIRNIGYKNLELFKKMVEPYYIGRKKSAVAKDLPKIVHKDVYLEMEPGQQKLYDQIKSGILQDSSAQGFRNVDPLTKMVFLQLVSDSPLLLSDPHDLPSSKEAELLRILEEELAGEKVVIYSKFRRGVVRLNKILLDKGINNVMIHGEIKSTDREINKKRFQTSADCNVIIINDAGGEAINLQQAGYLIYYNLPWSLGTAVQVLGRIHRIGSTHDNVTIISLVNKGTVDEYTLEILQKKLEVFEAVFGGQDGFLKKEEDDIRQEVMVKLGLTKKKNDEDLEVVSEVEIKKKTVDLMAGVPLPIDEYMDALDWGDKQ